MKKLKKCIAIIIRSNFIKYVGIFILNTIVIMDTVTKMCIRDRNYIIKQIIFI